MVKRLLRLLAFILPISASAATTNIACSFAQLTNAMQVMNDGDTINIAAGQDVWLSQVTVGSGGLGTTSPKSLHIFGAGSGIQGSNYFTTPCGNFLIQSQTPGQVTTFVGAPAFGALNLKYIGTNTDFQLAHINFAISNVQIFGTGPNVPNLSPWFSNSVWHVWDCQFTNINAGQHVIFPGFGQSFGLLDHCYFVITPNASGSWTVLQSQGNAYFSWTNMVNPLGTTNACVYENNWILNLSTARGNGFWDGYSGGQEVIRNNFLDGQNGGGAANGAHGYDSGDTSCRMVEIYCNILTNWDSGSANPFQTRGGLFEVFSNTMYYTNSSQTVTNMQPQIEYDRGASGANYSTYTYLGTYQTNWWFTNNDTVTADGYFMTNQWWDFFQSNRTGAFHYETTSTNISAAHSNQLYFNYSSGQMAIGTGKYTFTSNLNSSTPGQTVAYGTNLAETIINFASLLNWNLADAGKRWAQNTTNFGTFGPNGGISANFGRNPDSWVPFYGSNYMVIQNAMDGTNSFSGSQTGIGYPGAMMPSVYSLTRYTNNGNLAFPMYQWSNTIVSNNVVLPVTDKFQLKDLPPQVNPSNGVPIFTTNLFQANRDYFDDVVAPYTPLVFPHPLQADETGPPPVFSVQPQSQVICVSSNATFTVLATGTAPITYQWFNGITPISNATNTSLTLSNNVVSTTVNCQASNPGGTTASATANLTVQNCIPYVGADGFSGAVIIQGAVTIDK